MYAILFCTVDDQRVTESEEVLPLHVLNELDSN